MALPRSLSFLRQGTGAQVLEVYLDPQCPYSKKITLALNSYVLPLLGKGGKYEGKLSLIPRIYAQPFHYLSHVQSEAILAVGQTYPDAFWPYLLAVYDIQKEFFNVPAQSMTIDQCRDKLVHLALAVVQSGGHAQPPMSQVFGKIKDMLQVVEGPDGSSNGTNDVVFGFKHTIKIGRQNGIHVTPTVLFDGLVEASVSSSWGQPEWEKFLACVSTSSSSTSIPSSLRWNALTRSEKMAQ